MRAMGKSRAVGAGIIAGAIATCALLGPAMAAAPQALAANDAAVCTAITAVATAPEAQSGAARLAQCCAPATTASGYSTMSTTTGYLSAKKAYTALNKFRTTKKIWYWNANNKTKTKFNTKKSNTLKPLKKNAALEKTAKKRAKELVKVFDHTRPDGTLCFTVYPSNMLALGENIAYGTAPLSGNQVTKLWQEDNYKYAGQGHRRNMLSKDFNVVGIACYSKGGVNYWVQAFGKK